MVGGTDCVRWSWRIRVAGWFGARWFGILRIPYEKGLLFGGYHDQINHTNSRSSSSLISLIIFDWNCEHRTFCSLLFNMKYWKSWFKSIQFGYFLSSGWAKSCFCFHPLRGLPAAHVLLIACLWMLDCSSNRGLYQWILFINTINSDSYYVSCIQQCTKDKEMCTVYIWSSPPWFPPTPPPKGGIRHTYAAMYRYNYMFVLIYVCMPVCLSVCLLVCKYVRVPARSTCHCFCVCTQRYYMYT